MAKSPGEFHGLYSPWGRRESDMTEQLSKQTQLHMTLKPLNLLSSTPDTNTAARITHESSQLRNHGVPDLVVSKLFDEAAATPPHASSFSFLTSDGGLHMTVTQFSQKATYK